MGTVSSTTVEVMGAEVLKIMESVGVVLLYVRLLGGLSGLRELCDASLDGC
jgi:hypothetical protein